MKVRDFIQMDIDIDVYDDVCEELGIAFCGPLELTDAGAEKFAEVLDYDIKLHDNGAAIVGIVHVDGDDGNAWKKRLHKAAEFFEGAAGWCAASDYDKWFRT